MQIAVLSDVHSNLEALRRVLHECRDVDAIWCLGDIVGYGPEPNEVIALLRERGAVSVAGNHDCAAVGLMDTKDFNDDAARAARWTAQQLCDESRDFILGLPQRHVEGEHTLAHGSPRDPLWEYILDAGRARANLVHFDTRICLVGHTHVPSAFLQKKDDSVFAAYAEAESVLDLSTLTGKAILNPGSVGQPRDGDPRASYMIIDLDSLMVTWKRVEYDISRTQESMRLAQLPTRLVERLVRGR